MRQYQLPLKVSVEYTDSHSGSYFVSQEKQSIVLFLNYLKGYCIFLDLFMTLLKDFEKGSF